MTPAQRRYLRRYIRGALEIFGLSSWRFRLLREVPKYYASLTANVDKNICTIGLGPSFFSATPEKQREYIAHELLHLIRRKSYEVLFTKARPHLGEEEWNRFVSAYDKQEEKEVDAFARRVASLLPEVDLR